MTKPLSLDLRTRVVAAVDGGLSRRQAAERFGVSAASAVRWCALKAQAGDPAPKPQGGDRRSWRIEAHADLILKLLAEKADITLADMQAKLLEHGVKAGMGTLWRFFKRHNITLKKSPGHAAEQERPDVLRRREAWFEQQLDLDPDHLVFIDETGASTKMARLYGRAPRGERLRSLIPRGHTG